MIRFKKNLFFLVILFSHSLLLTGCFSAQSDQQWAPFPKNIAYLTLSNDGQKTLGVTTENRLIFWDLKHNREITTFNSNNRNHNNIFLAKFSQNARYAVTVSLIKEEMKQEKKESPDFIVTFAIWDLQQQQEMGLWSISGPVHIYDVDLSNDGRQVLLGLKNKVIYIDLDTERRLEFFSELQEVTSVALSTNGKYALTVGKNNAITKIDRPKSTDHKNNNAYLWDTTTAQVIYTFKHKFPINKVALHSAGNYAFTADSKGNGFIWNLTTGDQVSTLQSNSHYKNFSSALFSSGGRFLLTGDFSGHIDLWQSSTGVLLKSWQAKKRDRKRNINSSIINSVAFATDYNKPVQQHSNNDRVVIASATGLIEAWNLF